MESANAQQQKQAVLCIDGEMTIYRAAELKQAFLVALATHSVLEVDLSGVTEIDTAGVQLLIATKVIGLARDCRLRLVGHSAVVLDVFELLCLSAYFGDQLVMPSRAAASARN